MENSSEALRNYELAKRKKRQQRKGDPAPAPVELHQGGDIVRGTPNKKNQVAW